MHNLYGRFNPIRTVLIFCLALIISACGFDHNTGDIDPDTGLTKVILQTDWYAEPEHGGFYEALIKGYYRDVGLDIEIRPTSPSNSVYALVASGKADFGLGTSDNLIIAMSQNIPLTGVFPYFQHDPQGVMFHAESGITSLKDLDGRTVMISPILHYVDFLARAMNIHMNLIPLDGGVSRFVQDKQFVQQAFLTSEPYMAMQQGAEPQLLPFWDTGYDPYRLVFTRNEFSENNRVLVQGFISATQKGWQSYLKGDRREVNAKILALNPGQSEAFMTWTFNKMQQYSLSYGHEEHGESLGQINLNRIQTQIDQLTELELLKRPITLNEVIAPNLYPAELSELIVTNTEITP